MAWYRFDSLLGFNAVYNFTIGTRGAGKSFAIKEYCINRFLKKKAQFIYCRRYKTELKKIRTFFDDVRFKFPDAKFDVKGNKFYINGELAGYAIPLSTSQIEKSNSYPNVETIIFDEFIIDTHTYHYLPEEFTTFANLYSTVDRDKDKVRVFFIGNSLSIVNPYFTALDVVPDMNRRFTKVIRNGVVLAVIEVWKDEAQVAQARQTRFGQLMLGTEFDSMAHDNVFINDDDSFIKNMPTNTRHKISLKYRGHVIGLFENKDDFTVYVSTKRGKGLCVALTIQDADEIFSFVSPDDLKISQAVSSLIKSNQLYYESQEAKKEFFECCKGLRIR